MGQKNDKVSRSDSSPDKEKGRIAREINEFPVVVYSQVGCGYCDLAKELLNNESIRFNERELRSVERQNPHEYQAYLNELTGLTKYRKVPQVFICGKFIGGYTELSKLQQTDKLKEEIDRCAHLYA